MTDNSDRDVLRAALSREAVVPKRERFRPWDIDRAFCEQDGFCADCEYMLSEGPYHADHIVPVELGGETAFKNLQLLCPACHQKKTKSDMERIRKAARLRRDADPETRRRSARPLRGRGFQKADELK